MPLFRGRPLLYVDTSRTSEQFVEINYMRIGLSIADITVLLVPHKSGFGMVTVYIFYFPFYES
jgi:hypothetical protein